MVQGTLAKSQKCSSSISPGPMTADDEHQTSSQYHTDGLEDLPTTQASLDDERKLHEFPESLRLFYADPSSPEAFAAKERYLELFNKRLEAGGSEYSRKVFVRLRMPNAANSQF